MRVVIAGAGNIGRYLSVDLVNRGHEVTLIDSSDAALDKVPDGGTNLLNGDACAPKVLERAGTREADVVIAATGDDEDNLVISLLAKQEFAVPRVLARVNHPVNEWLFDDSWGVDLAVSPPHLLTALVEEEVSTGDLVPLLKLQRGRVELLEIRLDAMSPVIDKRVEEIDLPPNVTLVAVVRDGHVAPCRGTTPLTEGDELLALVGEGSIDELRERLVGDRHTTR
ncbi:MAG: TrkA family potassium uptake protein [Euzebyales bacterium]|nr:TrkA family potassium uptake protein [Euzebyales bacterium]MBA3620986.1 TrkA family potassium uptake protein [Euzebyales bacterium]